MLSSSRCRRGRCCTSPTAGGVGRQRAGHSTRQAKLRICLHSDSKVLGGGTLCMLDCRAQGACSDQDAQLLLLCFCFTHNQLQPDQQTTSPAAATAHGSHTGTHGTHTVVHVYHGVQLPVHLDSLCFSPQQLQPDQQTISLADATGHVQLSMRHVQLCMGVRHIPGQACACLLGETAAQASTLYISASALNSCSQTSRP